MLRKAFATLVAIAALVLVAKVVTTPGPTAADAKDATKALGPVRDVDLRLGL